MGEVNLDDLSKRYDDVQAVDDVDIDIRDGEFVTLVGPSGCGKSTTLEMIAGLTSPTDGAVHIAGRDVTDLPPKSRGIAMVFQNIALFPHMDVHDNISFGLRLRDVDDDEIDDRVERAAEVVQMQGMLDRMPEELSGGQRQRVAIGRAIVREPAVFLMDEPLANLDAALRVHMRTQLQRIHDELETTIVYVTHDQEEAMTMSNRLAVMNDGEVQQFDTPLSCYNRPANRFVAGFIGSPSMNFVDGEVVGSGLSTPYFDLEFDPANTQVAPGTEVTAGVRPEDVALADNREHLEDASGSISATIDVIEPVGDEVYLYLRLDESAAESGFDVQEEDDQILMSTPPDPNRDIEAMRSESIEVHVDLSRVHLFDRETGEAITHGLTREMDSSTVQSLTD